MQYVFVHFNGKLNFVKTAGFYSAGRNIGYMIAIFCRLNAKKFSVWKSVVTNSDAQVIG